MDANAIVYLIFEKLAFIRVSRWNRCPCPSFCLCLEY
ncbi:hypothetical protein OIU77_027165 [Salix suchowensis]|uniref:Uncharacterized protein n=1 Tax=Salix suchowensis TaxID=1278906 RepID=A0ABQ9BNQ7_9ROSI|nr:hypothetical protein OIU77_027165 [Salix suchowensis]